MACVSKIAIIVFLAALINRAPTGNAQGQLRGCTLSDIKITQEKTGKVVEGQPEYIVTVENLCPCAQDNVLLRCNRLPSVEPIDSRAIKVLDELCKVSGALFKGSKVTFTYAWKTPQDFTVVSAIASCSSAENKHT